jgi:two-component system nitrate/nitrite response regulator NarL
MCRPAVGPPASDEGSPLFMRPKGTIRIVIADDHPIFRLGVKSLLSQERGFDVIGEAGTADQIVDAVTTLRPDILLLDHVMPRLNGLEVLRRLAGLKVPTRTIVVSASIQESEIQTALLHGAWGVVLKHTAIEVLAKCIRQVMVGEHWVGVESVNALIGGLRTPSAGAGSSSLTPRELDVVRRIAKGASNKDIAWQLGLSEQTVKNYLRRIFEKLNVANRVELAVHIVASQMASEAEPKSSDK